MKDLSYRQIKSVTSLPPASGLAGVVVTLTSDNALYYSDGSWDLKQPKRWNGSSRVNTQIKYFNGSTWNESN